MSLCYNECASVVSSFRFPVYPLPVLQCVLFLVCDYNVVQTFNSRTYSPRGYNVPRDYHAF